MKTLKFLQILLLFTLCSFYGCDEFEEKESTELPPETQIGANTFGCYINDELFVAKESVGSWMITEELYAIYTSDEDYLEINAPRLSGGIGLYILYPKEGLSISTFNIYMNYGGHAYEENNLVLNFDSTRRHVFYHTPKDILKDIGEINITKLDTINKIVSGTFHCNSKIKGNYSNVKDSALYLSQGRFDLPLRIYYK